MRKEPTLFAGFSDRVAGLSPKLDRMRLRVEETKTRQLAFLQSVATEELRAQKQRLETYTVQARFALADIYDRSATIGASAQ